MRLVLLTIIRKEVDTYYTKSDGVCVGSHLRINILQEPAEGFTAESLFKSFSVSDITNIDSWVLHTQTHAIVNIQEFIYRVQNRMAARTWKLSCTSISALQVQALMLTLSEVILYASAFQCVMYSSEVRAH